MNIQDLNSDDQMLVQTQFPEQLEKEAQADAQLVHELYATGFDKLASGTIESIEKAAEESEKDDDDDKEEGEKDESYKEKMDEGEKKEAAARGAFIARGYIDGLMKEGSAQTGDPYFYIYDLMAEKVAHDSECTEQEKVAAIEVLASLKQKALGMGKKMMGMAKKEYAGSKGRMAAAMSGKGTGRARDLSAGKRLALAGRAMAVPAAAGVTTVGAHQMLKD